jgi:hypothetical protein
MLTRDQLDYVRGLVRGDRRKKEQGLAKATPFPGQPAEDFETFRAGIRTKLAHIDATLEGLDALASRVARAEREAEPPIRTFRDLVRAQRGVSERDDDATAARFAAGDPNPYREP